VAFSGGVDSTLLLKAAHEELRERAIAVTARSCSFPARELGEAAAFCSSEGIEHIICDSEELDIEGFAENPRNRCYLCKNELFGKIWNEARARGIQNVADGTNTDDEGDWRPGLQAAAELGVVSPLREAGMSKDDIRAISRELGLATWDKQSFACLASRFPYGEKITREKLGMIDRAEQYLLDIGLRQVRVRRHGDVARIETDEPGTLILMDRPLRTAVHEKLREIGFTYVSLDLLGYRTGSMNETL
jgi:uncharacterized protein